MSMWETQGHVDGSRTNGMFLCMRTSRTTWTLAGSLGQNKDPKDICDKGRCELDELAHTKKRRTYITDRSPHAVNWSSKKLKTPPCALCPFCGEGDRALLSDTSGPT